jgi:hypothetical protein
MPNQEPMPEMPPMGGANPAPPMPTSDEEQGMPPNDDMGTDNQEDGGTELQSDAAKLAQKISQANPEEAKTAIKQFNSVAVKALGSNDAEDVIKGIEKASEGNEPENGEQETEMPTESIASKKENYLNEIIDSILNGDDEEEDRRQSKQNKKIKKSSPWRQ